MFADCEELEYISGVADKFESIVVGINYGRTKCRKEKNQSWELTN